ncbi:glycosyltransferase family 39 protein [bacterium]|nr:glycosyltransferase family 39 protein [candidate division CSSED10-310 bacterium]
MANWVNYRWVSILVFVVILQCIGAGGVMLLINDYNTGMWVTIADNILKGNSWTPNYFNHPPLVILVTLCIKWLSSGTFALRIVPIGFSLAGLVLLTRVYRLLGEDHRIATGAASIFAVSPMYLHYGRMLNHEAFIMPFIYLALIGGIRWCENGRFRWVVLTMVGLAGIGVTDYYGAQVLIPLAVACHGKRSWTPLIASTVILLSMYGSWVLFAHWMGGSELLIYSARHWSIDNLNRICDPGFLKMLLTKHFLRLYTPVTVILGFLGWFHFKRNRVVIGWMAAALVHFLIVPLWFQHRYAMYYWGPLIALLAAHGIEWIGYQAAGLFQGKRLKSGSYGKAVTASIWLIIVASGSTYYLKHLALPPSDSVAIYDCMKDLKTTRPVLCFGEMPQFPAFEYLTGLEFEFSDYPGGPSPEKLAWDIVVSDQPHRVTGEWMTLLRVCEYRKCGKYGLWVCKTAGTVATESAHQQHREKLQETQSGIYSKAKLHDHVPAKGISMWIGR